MTNCPLSECPLLSNACFQECVLQFFFYFCGSLSLSTTFSRRRRKSRVSFWYLHLMESNPCTLSNHSNVKTEEKALFQAMVCILQSLPLQEKPFLLGFGGQQKNWTHLSDTSRICPCLLFSCTVPRFSPLLLV